MLYFSCVLDFKMVGFISLLGRSLNLNANLRSRNRYSTYFWTEEVFDTVTDTHVPSGYFKKAGTKQKHSGTKMTSAYWLPDRISKKMTDGEGGGWDIWLFDRKISLISPQYTQRWRKCQYQRGSGEHSHKPIKRNEGGILWKHNPWWISFEFDVIIECFFF